MLQFSSFRPIIFRLLPVLVFLANPAVWAGDYEVSGSFSFNGSNYGDGNYSWSRRWSASIGYQFWGQSEIEISFQDVYDRTKIDGYADTSYHDQVYSIEWVQVLADKRWMFQPFIKLGAGQLNRTASGSYAGGVAPPAVFDSLTVVAGAGLKIFLLRSVALKAEGTSYLAGGSISTFRDNFSINFGGSVYF